MTEPFENQLKLIKLCGFARSRTLKWKILHILIILIMSYELFVITTFLQRHFSDNIIDTAEVITSIITCLTALVKFLMMLTYSNEVFDLIGDLQELNTKWQQKDQNLKIDEVNRLDRFVFKVMAGSCIFGIASYIILPLLTNFIGVFILGSPFQYIILFKSSFYYDLTYQPFYWMTFLMQSSSACMETCFHAIVDTTFFAICMNISAHFEIMQSISNDIPVKDFVDYHRTILEITNKMQKVFKIIIFMIYFMISLLLCVLDFQIIMNQDMSKIIPGIFHTIAAITELLIFSYGGHRVMDSAADICKDCYEHEKFMVMMRTKKELKIQSLIYHAALPTFSLTISRAMSLIALMKSFL